MRFKAIIFDMDGTLLDTVADIGEAANRVLSYKGFPQHPLESYKHFVGEGAGILIERALPAKSRTDELIGECLEMFFQEYGNTWNNHTRLYPGIKELLNSLSELPVTLSILSNKPDGFTKACANEYLDAWEFFRVIGNSDAIPRKPDPTGAISIISELKLAAEDCLFVGDTKIDMQTAKAAGMTSIGVLWGFRPREELVEARANHLVDEPAQMLNILQ